MNSTGKESQLQTRLRANDKKAFEEVYTMYREQFINYSKRYNLDRSYILDIYQDSVIALYQKFVMTQLELEKSTIKTYLFGIGKNKIFNILKEEQRFLRVEIEADNYTEITIDSDEPTLRQIALSKNIKQISESCTDLLKLFYYRNLTIEEIVELTHYKDGNTVRSHKSRCLKHLKSLFNVN